MNNLRLTVDDLREGNRQDLGRQLKEYLEYIEWDLEQISEDSKIPKITIEMITLGTCTDFNCYLDLIRFLKLKPEITIPIAQLNPILLY